MAISEYQKAVRINPWEQTYYQNLAKIYQDVTLLIPDKIQRIRLLEKSVAVYKKHLELVPQDALSHNGLGVGYVHMAEQLSDQSYYQLAQESFQRSVERAPYFLEPYINLGTVLYRLGKKEEALQSYDKALQVNPYVPLIYLNLGNLYAQEGEIRKAIGYWQDALDLDPNLGEARRNIEMNRKFIEEPLGKE
ncbi:Photosystem I assembly protein Ycf3 [subsurface metagenome]